MFRKTLNRLSSKLIRLIRDQGYFLPIRQFTKVTNTNQPFKMLIVAPGIMAIPPLGWGAVEHIIEETLQIFEDSGFEIWILNSKNKRDWKKASLVGYHVILNHSDQDTLKIRNNWPETPLITVSHYGLGAFESLWDKNYKKILKKVDASDKIICLSEEVKVTYAKYINESKLLVSPNGSSFDPIIGRDVMAPLVCIGKIETRKHQYELWKIFQNSQRKIVFIGPITDVRVLKAIKIDKNNQKFFIGSRNRKYLAQNLHKFSGLILLSLGEADALVLYEAQLAGLPILVTKNGLGSQNIDLDWVKVIPQNPEAEQIELMLNSIETSTSVISEYARHHYSWSVRSKPLLGELLFQAKFCSERNQLNLK